MEPADSTPRMAGKQRIIVKVGSALLVDNETGQVRRAWLEALIDDIAALRARGHEILVVSSGAVAVGKRRLAANGGTAWMGYNQSLLVYRQAAAAVGQVELAEVWRAGLARYDITMAQVLLTLDDTESRERYQNARATIRGLLEFRAVPVINENDTVGTEELRVGDNDRLAAKVGHMTGADLLVLLTNVDGLYTADPGRDPSAELLERVDGLTPEIHAMAGGSSRGSVGSGGMVTKLEAARIAMAAGCEMVIAQGGGYHPLKAIDEGAPCTWFVPAETPLSARRHWIATGLNPRGFIRLDPGAIRAIRAGKNLLPAGVTAVGGDFVQGDAVQLVDDQDHEVARGLVAYSAPDTERIAGSQSKDIAAVLGYSRGNALVHSDDIVLTAENGAG